MQKFTAILLSLAVCGLIVAQIEAVEDEVTKREILEECANTDEAGCKQCCSEKQYDFGFLFDKTHKPAEIEKSCVCQEADGKNVLSSDCYTKSEQDCSACCAGTERFTSGEFLPNFAGLADHTVNGGQICVCEN